MKENFELKVEVGKPSNLKIYPVNEYQLDIISQGYAKAKKDAEKFQRQTPKAATFCASVGVSFLLSFFVCKFVSPSTSPLVWVILAVAVCALIGALGIVYYSYQQKVIAKKNDLVLSTIREIRDTIEKEEKSNAEEFLETLELMELESQEK